MVEAAWFDEFTNFTRPRIGSNGFPRADDRSSLRQPCRMERIAHLRQLAANIDPSLQRFRFFGRSDWFAGDSKSSGRTILVLAERDNRLRNRGNVGAPILLGQYVS